MEIPVFLENKIKLTDQKLHFSLANQKRVIDLSLFTYKCSRPTLAALSSGPLWLRN